jgi:TolA-binding protein
MAEQSNNVFNDQPVLIEDNGLATFARNIIIGLVAVIIAAIVVIYYWNRKQHTEEAAAAALANANGAEQLQTVLDQYPDTAAAATALLFIASSRQEKQDYAAAADWYARYLQKNAKSPLAPVAQFAQAECLAAAGKKGEARAAYLAITNAKPANPYSGGAAVALARIYLADNNANAARQTLTDFLSRDVNSSFQVEAGKLLRELPQDSSVKK